MSGFAENVARVRREIAAACARVGRTSEPRVIAVTKNHPADVLPELAASGIADAGENYVQELLSKMEVCPALRWHFIGGLQRNKAKYIAGRVAIIHSVDSLALALEIGKRAAARGVVQEILIQINQGEATKGGVTAADAVQLTDELNAVTSVRLRGLMAMPPFFDEPERARPCFREVRELRDEINRRAVYREELTELSMGMSGDYAVAVEEGATMVRLGTVLFGARTYPSKENEI